MPCDKEKLKLELHVAQEALRLPAGAAKAVQGTYACCYGWDDRVLFASISGDSQISFDPVRSKAVGFINTDLSRDSQRFFALLGMTVIETLKYRRLYFLHGACVSRNGRSYLFSGHSGSGKSTAAFNLVRQGFQFVADDSLLLSEQNGKIAVSPYYTNFHVDAELIKRCPEIVDARELDDRDRGFARMRVNMSEIYPGSFVASLEPDRIIFPQVIPNGSSSFSAISQMAVYEGLLKQTILAVDANIAREQLRVIEKLAKQVKGFNLLTGPDMYEDPKILSALLEQMS